MADLNNIPDSRDSKRPVPPESVIDWVPANPQDSPSKATDIDNGEISCPSESANLAEKEPSDILGALSMCFGLLALLMTPVATVMTSGLWAFSITAIIFGLVRLVDHRFAMRSDMAVAGIISSLVVIGLLVVLSAQQEFGKFSTIICNGSDKDSPADTSYGKGYWDDDDFAYEDYGLRDYGSHGHGRHHEGESDDDEPLGDSIRSTLEKFDDAMKKLDERIENLHGKDDNDAVKKDENKTNKDETDKDDKEDKEDKDEKKNMQQVPRATPDADSIKRVPLAGESDDTTHEA